MGLVGNLSLLSFYIIEKHSFFKYIYYQPPFSNTVILFSYIWQMGTIIIMHIVES